MRRGPSKRGRRAHDVAVYAPSGSLYYGPKRDYMGGAEVQATKLAHALKAKGLRVAHVVYPVPEPRRVDASSPTLVERSIGRGTAGWASSSRPGRSGAASSAPTPRRTSCVARAAT